ncbi:putative cysteine desulfurase [Caloramator mitchellensis]|uniref:cysteine desulfurase n=1 Tax=Caloramator mitchellensis TaxID=908809 RepID=A0A0R3JX23_CALMK|nr:aminotransferase class V-fold PLP-dependent enzyme [Caloramator mitchellensis]KRQ88072.1 putative cysteine desulfurase [Caloramator mitchellensis]
MRRIYLDNAATTFPKAPTVAKSMVEYIEHIGGNVGRGTHFSSYTAGSVVYETRELLSKLFVFDDPMKVVFTMNITQSINMILKGFLKSGDHVIITSMEHNAVLRPLSSLSKEGVQFDVLQCDETGFLNPEIILKFIRPNTKLIIMSHASNVTGTIQNIKRIGQICKEKNVYFCLDSAQTAGVLDIDFYDLNLSALAFTGHKGLLGPQGIGGFLISTEFANEIKPLIEGGTGSLSESEFQPSFLPDKFESGTLNIPGIFGLNAAIKYILNIGTEEIRNKEKELTNRFLNKVLNIDNINVLGPKNVEFQTAVVSIDFKNIDNSEAAFLLDNQFGIMTRVGLHCAPLAHKTLGTFPKGTVRFSFGHFNTIEEVDYAADCIYKIANSQV